MRCTCVGRLGLEIQLHTDTLWLSSLLSSSSTDVWCQARPPATLAHVLLGLTLPGVINILTHVELAALGRTPVGKVRLSR